MIGKSNWHVIEELTYKTKVLILVSEVRAF